MTLHDFFHTDAGLLIRIAIGVSIFATLAIFDLRKNAAKAKRWREYSVLTASVLAALAYGAINDQITVTISPEYFLYGKELAHALGDNPPMSQLRWEAAKVGLKATWSAGLIFGVVLLIANNPYKSLPRLRNRQLLVYLPMILMTAAACGGIGAWLGYHGHLTRLGPDFQSLIDLQMYRPYRFMCAWGVHLGGYAGGVIGTVISASLVLSRRATKRASRYRGSDVLPE